MLGPTVHMLVHRGQVYLENWMGCVFVVVAKLHLSNTTKIDTILVLLL